MSHRKARGRRETRDRQGREMGRALRLSVIPSPRETRRLGNRHFYDALLLFFHPPLRRLGSTATQIRTLVSSSDHYSVFIHPSFDRGPLKPCVRQTPSLTCSIHPCDSTEAIESNHASTGFCPSPSTLSPFEKATHCVL